MAWVPSTPSCRSQFPSVESLGSKSPSVIPEETTPEDEEAISWYNWGFVLLWQILLASSRDPAHKLNQNRKCIDLCSGDCMMDPELQAQLDPGAEMMSSQSTPLCRGQILSLFSTAMLYKVTANPRAVDAKS